jgi:hypothetical protein
MKAETSDSAPAARVAAVVPQQQQRKVIAFAILCLGCFVAFLDIQIVSASIDDSRRPLSQPGSGPRRECHPEARKGNKNSQLGYDGLTRNEEKLSNINWLGFLDSFRTLCFDSKGEIQSLFEEMRASGCQFSV